MLIGKIIGIDPGSTTLGLGIISFDLNNYTIVESTANTFDFSKNNDFSWMEDYHPDRFRRMQSLIYRLTLTFKEEQPIIIASESPFYNMRRPNAYGVLVEVIDSIRMAVWYYEKTLPLKMIDPPSVKNALGAKGNAKKEEVQEALSKMTHLKLNKSINTLSEHAVDALGVAYSAYKDLLGVVHGKA